MKTHIHLWLLLMTVALASALGTPSDQKYAPRETVPLVAPALIDQAQLTANWQMNLPVKQKESLSRMDVFGPYLYVLTDTNVMFCIDRAKGKLVFTQRLSALDLPVCKPLYFEEDFWFVVGSRMMVFDPSAGYITDRQELTQIGNISEYGFARNKTHLYLAGSDRRLHVINADGYWQQFTVTADNDSEIVSVAAANEIVVFATRAGNVVAMKPNEAVKVWQFDLTGQIAAPLEMEEESVFAAGLDAKLYKLNLKTGKLAWTTPFHSGAPIHKPLTVGAELVYVVNSLNGLYGVDKQTGKAVWQIPAGRGMMCEAAGNSYVYAAPGILKCMDNKSGKERYSMNFSEVQLWAPNTTDAQMYLADLKGRLMNVTVR